MNNKNESIFLSFGNVAYPYTVEEALNGGACYGRDERVDQIKTTITEIRDALKKLAPLIPTDSASDTQGGDEGLLEALRLLLEPKKARSTHQANDSDDEEIICR